MTKRKPLTKEMRKEIMAIINNSKPIEPEFAEVIEKEFWKLI